MVMMTEKKIGLSTSTAAARIRCSLSPAARVGWMTRRVMREMAEDVFHHDDGAVDDNAEIDGADRQQIGGIAAQHRDDDRKEQRDRNGGRHDQRAAQVAEENPLDQEDQRDAEQHVVHHGAHRDRDQIAAVVEWLDLDAGWQAAVAVDALDRRAHARHHIHGALELLHQHDAEQDVVLIVAAGNAEARREPDLVVGNIR